MKGTVIAPDGLALGSVSFSNNVGGTSEVPAGSYRVEVIGGFHDYECGQVIHARLLDPEQIEAVRKIGEVHQPEWTAKGTSKIPSGRAETAMQTDMVFDPSFVMFHPYEGQWFPDEEAP